jgi:2'-5' RNA ligase
VRYIMPCLLPPPVQAYHKELVDLVAERFGLTFTQRQAIPAHFTLKYHFTTPEIGQMEALLDDFVRRHRRAPISVGGFGHFAEDVVFVDVQLSAEARRVLEALVSALTTLPWMSWNQFDAERLHPHLTIVERCRPRFAEIWEFVETRERRFTAWLDNVTILKKVGETDGMDLWAVHRSFNLEA